MADNDIESIEFPLIIKGEPNVRVALNPYPKGSLEYQLMVKLSALGPYYQYVYDGKLSETDARLLIMTSAADVVKIFEHEVKIIDSKKKRISALVSVFLNTEVQLLQQQFNQLIKIVGSEAIEEYNREFIKAFLKVKRQDYLNYFIDNKILLENYVKYLAWSHHDYTWSLLKSKRSPDNSISNTDEVQQSLNFFGRSKHMPAMLARLYLALDAIFADGLTQDEEEFMTLGWREHTNHFLDNAKPYTPEQRLRRFVLLLKESSSIFEEKFDKVLGMIKKEDWQVHKDDLFAIVLTMANHRCLKAMLENEDFAKPLLAYIKTHIDDLMTYWLSFREQLEKIDVLVQRENIGNDYSETSNSICKNDPLFRASIKMKHFPLCNYIVQNVDEERQRILAMSDAGHNVYLAFWNYYVADENSFKEIFLTLFEKLPLDDKYYVKLFHAAAQRGTKAILIELTQKRQNLPQWLIGFSFFDQFTEPKTAQYLLATYSFLYNMDFKSERKVLESELESTEDEVDLYFGRSANDKLDKLENLHAQVTVAYLKKLHRVFRQHQKKNIDFDFVSEEGVVDSEKALYAYYVLRHCLRNYNNPDSKMVKASLNDIKRLLSINSVKQLLIHNQTSLCLPDDYEDTISSDDAIKDHQTLYPAGRRQYALEANECYQWALRSGDNKLLVTLLETVPELSAICKQELIADEASNEKLLVYLKYPPDIFDRCKSKIRLKLDNDTMDRLIIFDPLTVDTSIDSKDVNGKWLAYFKHNSLAFDLCKPAMIAALSEQQLIEFLSFDVSDPTKTFSQQREGSRKNESSKGKQEQYEKIDTSSDACDKTSTNSWFPFFSSNNHVKTKEQLRAELESHRKTHAAKPDKMHRAKYTILSVALDVLDDKSSVADLEVAKGENPQYSSTYFSSTTKSLIDEVIAMYQQQSPVLN